MAVVSCKGICFGYNQLNKEIIYVGKKKVEKSSQCHPLLALLPFLLCSALLCSNTLSVTTVCPYDSSGLSDVMDAL